MKKNSDVRPGHVVRTAIRRLSLVAVVFGAAAASGPLLALNSQDGFTEERLAQAQASALAGAWEQAVLDFRLACFGLLEEPPQLTDCLSRQALAEINSNLPDAAQTLERIVMLETRFSTVSQSSLPPAVLEQVVEAIVLRLPAERLQRSEYFAAISTQRAEEHALRALAGRSASERISELTSRLSSMPDSVPTLLALADAEFEGGKRSAANEHARSALALVPSSIQAQCLEAATRLAETVGCRANAEKVAQCAAASDHLHFAEPLLRCFLVEQAWEPFDGLVERLTPAVKEARPIRQLVRRAAASRRETARRETSGGKILGDRDPEGETSSSNLGSREAGEVMTAPEQDATNESVAEVSEPVSPNPHLTPAAQPTPAPIEEKETEDIEAVVAQLAGRLNLTAKPQQLEQLLADVEVLVADHPGLDSARHLAGDTCYVLRRWKEAVFHYEGGRLPREANRLFYYAVSLFEIGRHGEAAEIARRVRASVDTRNPAIANYFVRILGE